jgi:hypothetical protein
MSVGGRAGCLQRSIDLRYLARTKAKFKSSYDPGNLLRTSYTNDRACNGRIVQRPGYRHFARCAAMPRAYFAQQFDQLQIP